MPVIEKKTYPHNNKQTENSKTEQYKKQQTATIPNQRTHCNGNKNIRNSQTKAEQHDNKNQTNIIKPVQYSANLVPCEREGSGGKSISYRPSLLSLRLRAIARGFGNASSPMSLRTLNGFSSRRSAHVICDVRA